MHTDSRQSAFLSLDPPFSSVREFHPTASVIEGNWPHLAIVPTKQSLYPPCCFDFSLTNNVVCGAFPHTTGKIAQAGKGVWIMDMSTCQQLLTQGWVALWKQYSSVAVFNQISGITSLFMYIKVDHFKLLATWAMTIVPIKIT